MLRRGTGGPTTGIGQFWLVEEAAEQVALVHRYQLREDTYELVDDGPLLLSQLETQ